MEFNKLVFAALSVGCLTAAAGGSYLAGRQNQSASAIVESSDLRPAPDGPAQKAPSAVTESEGVIAPEASRPEAAPPATPSAPARRAPSMAAPQNAPRAARVVQRPSTTSPSTRPSTPDSQPSGPAAGRSGQERVSETVSAPANGGTMWETRPSVAPSTPEYKEPEPPPPLPSARVRTVTGEIAIAKMKDLNTQDVEQAMRLVEGTARSMGLQVTE